MEPPTSQTRMSTTGMPIRSQRVGWTCCLGRTELAASWHIASLSSNLVIRDTAFRVGGDVPCSLLAFAGALVYGSADFLGGLAARRLRSIVVTAVAAASGPGAARSRLPPHRRRVARGGHRVGRPVGLTGAIAIVLLYACLAIGPMTRPVAAHRRRLGGRADPVGTRRRRRDAVLDRVRGPRRSRSSRSSWSRSSPARRSCRPERTGPALRRRSGPRDRRIPHRHRPDERRERARPAHRQPLREHAHHLGRRRHPRDRRGARRTARGERAGRDIDAPRRDADRSRGSRARRNRRRDSSRGRSIRCLVLVARRRMRRPRRPGEHRSAVRAADRRSRDRVGAHRDVPGRHGPARRGRAARAHRRRCSGSGSPSRFSRAGCWPSPDQACDCDAAGFSRA